MSEELQELMDNNPEWYKDILLVDAKEFIRANINSASRSFVAIGYYLKYIRNNEMFTEDGYQSIWEFAKSEFGIGKSSASQFMSINDKFSKDGNSPILLDQYKDFTSSKLAEMLTMTDEQLEQIKPTTTIVEIREIKKPAETILTSEQSEITEGPKTIDDLELSVRTYNCLKRADIDTVEELCELTEIEVIKIRNISQKCLDEIKEKLSKTGKSLKPDMPIGENGCTGECFWCADEDCNSYQEPREKCLFDSGVKCSIYGAHQVATTVCGVDCKSSCCMSCKEDCGARCNHSAHRDVTESVNTEPEYIETVSKSEKNVVVEPESVVEEVETVTADIIQTEPDETFTDQCETSGLKFNNWLKANGSSIADIVDVVLMSKKVPDEDNLYSQIKNGLISRLITKTEAYYSYLTRELGIEPERPKQIQPELPVLKNNDQRKDFIDTYEIWPIWIDQKETGERYYRYSLNDNVSMVVKVNRKHKYQSYHETKEYEYGAEQYYLHGIKSEWHQTGVVFTEDESRTFYECQSNKSALVDYLKYFQKK